MASRIPELAVKTFSNVAGTVFHPMMSKIRSDDAELYRYYYGALRYCALLMLGVGAAIVVLAEPLIHVLYDTRWYPMIVPMQLLAIAFALGTINMVPGSLFKALGRTDLMLRVSLINLPFFVLLIWLAVPHGIEAVAFIQVVLAIIRFIPNFLILRRSLGISGPHTAAALVPGLVCALAATAAGMAVQQVAYPNDFVRLLAAASAFVAAYVLSVRFAAPEVFREVVQRLMQRMRRA